MPGLTPVSIVKAGEEAADLLAVGLFEDGNVAASLSRKTLAGIRRAAEGFRGRQDDVAQVELRGGPVGQLRLVGLGKASAFDRRAASGFARALYGLARRDRPQSLAVALPDHPQTRDAATVRALLRDLLLGGYRFTSFIRRPKPGFPKRLRVLPPQGAEDLYRGSLRAARAVAAGVATARRLGNTPPNVATPEWMASEANALAQKTDMRIEVLGPDRLAELGMGGILAVGGGSRNEPRLVKLELGDGPLAVSLVGKGVTFDTGGISIKPATRMDEMKYDKCGACAVVGILEAAAGLDLPLTLRGYLPLAENMPDGAAYRPGDIVTLHNGKTVEIKNTDAEGRMILADALSLAAGERPHHLVEFSTLTGAAVVALGQIGAGLYSPDDGLADGLLAAAETTGERLWRMPLWPEFGEQMKGSHADLQNVAGRWGGANLAAAFLANFTGRVRSWAHLDIAGPAYSSASRKGGGASGYGVALAAEWLAALAAAD